MVMDSPQHRQFSSRAFVLPAVHGARHARMCTHTQATQSQVKEGQVSMEQWRGDALDLWTSPCRYHAEHPQCSWARDRRCEKTFSASLVLLYGSGAEGSSGSPCSSGMTPRRSPRSGCLPRCGGPCCCCCSSCNLLSLCENNCCSRTVLKCPFVSLWSSNCAFPLNHILHALQNTGSLGGLFAFGGGVNPISACSVAFSVPPSSLLSGLTVLDPASMAAGSRLSAARARVLEPLQPRA